MWPSSLGGAAYCVALCLSVCLSVRFVIITDRHVAPPSELQWHTCTFWHALRAAYRTAISAAQILVIDIESNTSLGGLTLEWLDPAGMHCPWWDDTFVSSYVSVLSLWPYMIYSTSMARYSIFMLKVLLNTKQTKKHNVKCHYLCWLLNFGFARMTTNRYIGQLPLVYNMTWLSDITDTEFIKVSFEK